MLGRNIILAGFMGSGKSRIGRILAEKLSMPFVDMDRTIEERQGKTVQQIFAEYGEPFFRELERQLCFELSRKSGVIIASGGGALIPQGNRDLFAEHSIFCLRAPFEVLAERLSRNQKRPLAPHAKQLWVERQPIYDKIFHQVESHKEAPDKIAERIARLYELDARFEVPKDSFYPVIIRSGAYEELPDFLEWLGLTQRKLAVISNPEIAAQHQPKIGELINIPEGESHKTLATVASLYNALLDGDFTRHDTLMALGGGVVGDITGFVAATYWRGMNYIQVPTSLLAMVDSSVGGKTGVDLPQGKNLVGAFKNPIGVLIDPAFLKTLPERELKCGLAEVVKHAVIGDLELFEHLEQGKMDLEWVIRRAIAVKIKIVREDPYEQDKRILLNLGHTFGHAIELLSCYEIRHGEAVAIGMVQAAEYALQQEVCQPKMVTRLRALLTKLGLPTDVPKEISKKDLWDAMRHDKKRKDGKLRLILPKDIGDVRVIAV
ncbi:MAG: 3-dehydroquinate synthase [Myxococcota bacterium]